MSSRQLKLQVMWRQLWNCWSLSAIILLPLHFFYQVIHWKDRGLDIFLSPFENFRETIAVAWMKKSLATLCLQLYERSKPSRGLLGFHYNGRPAVMVNDPIVIQRLLTEDSHNFEVLWRPDELMNPILAKCPMFCTNLNWMQRNVWTQERLDKVFHKLLSLKMMTLRTLMSLLYMMKWEGEKQAALHEVSCEFAEQVFIHVGLGLTNLTGKNFKNASAIFQMFIDAFETQTTEPRDTLYLLAQNIARNDKKVKIVPKKAEYKIRRIARRILKRNDINPEGRQCLLQWLNSEGLGLEDIVHHLYAFCFDLYIHLVRLGSLALRELAVDASIQNKLIEALNETEDRDGGKWLSQSILGLPVLNQFVNKVKRKYPLNGCIARICKTPTTLPVAPDSNYSIELTPGDLVFASTLGVTRDYDDVDLTYANPNAPILHVALIMLVATILRTNRIELGNQDIYEVKVNYDAILPENAYPLSATFKARDSQGGHLVELKRQIFNF